MELSMEKDTKMAKELGNAAYRSLLLGTTVVSLYKLSKKVQGKSFGSANNFVMESAGLSVSILAGTGVIALARFYTKFPPSEVLK